MIHSIEREASFYTTAVDAWHSLKDNSDFWDAYAHIAFMDPKKKNGLLIHDLRNTLSTNMIRYQLYSAATAEQTGDVIRMTNKVLRDSEMDLAELERLVSGIRALPTHAAEKPDAQPLTSLEMQDITKLNIFHQMLPALAASVHFLDTPNAFQLGVLMQPTITPEQLAMYTGVQFSCRFRNQPLRGIELIPLLNVLQNAAKFHANWMSQTREDTDDDTSAPKLWIPEPGSYVVVNKSSVGLPKNKNILLPGISNGQSSGFGLTIANAYAKLAGSSIEMSSISVPQEKNPAGTETHTVLFWLRPSDTPVSDRIHYTDYLPLPRYSVIYKAHPHANGRNGKTDYTH